MKRALIWIATIVIAILVIARIALWLEADTVASLITEKVKASAKNVDIVVLEPKISRLSYEAKQINLIDKKKRFSISAENLSVTPDLMALILGKISFNFTANIYKGTLHGAYTKSIFSNFETISTNLENIALNLHPQLKIFGIRDGSLTATANELYCEKTFCTKGALEVNIRSLSANSMFIGEITDGALHYRAHFTKEGLRIENIHSQSSLFNIEGEGVIPFEKTSELLHPFYLKVALTQRGKQQLAPMLNLLSGHDLSASDSFNLYWRGSLKNGRLELGK